MFVASGGSTLRVPGPGVALSSTGLTRDLFGAVTTTWSIVEADGEGTLLDLSGVESLDAGYPVHGNDVNRHYVSATGGATLDLSGLRTVLAPQGVHDFIEFRVEGASELRLGALETVTNVSRGGTYFRSSAGGTLELPSLATGEELVFVASGGSTLRVPGPGVALSSTGLTRDLFGAVTTTWSIVEADGEGTLLDLSGVESLDAGYPVHGNDLNRHYVSATGGATLDLSGLRTVLAPQGVHDFIEFRVEGTSELRLDALETVTNVSRGGTYFRSSAGGTLELPSLKSGEELVFVASGGSTLRVPGPGVALSSTGLTRDLFGAVTTNWSIVEAEGDGTLLDLSGVETLDTGFSRHGNDVNRHHITASAGGSIHLTGLRSLSLPQSAPDQVVVTASGDARIDLSSIESIESVGSGSGRIDVSGGAAIHLGFLEARSPVTATLSGGGTLTARSLRATATTTIALSDPADRVEVDLDLELGTTISIAAPNGGTITVGQSFRYEHDEEDLVALAAASLHMDGSGLQRLEVGGLNVGADPSPLSNDNFGYGQLVVGRDEQATVVELRDDHNNGNRATKEDLEALYLFGLGDEDGLRVLGGSTLVLGTVPVYAQVGGAMELLNNRLDAGAPAQPVPFDGGFLVGSLDGAFLLSGMLPNRGLANVELPALVGGRGFTDGVEVSLLGGDDVLAAGTAIDVLSSLQLSARFDLGGIAPGTYDLEAVHPDGRTTRLHAAFTVEQNSGPKLLVRKQATVPVPGRDARFYVIVKNVGQEAASDIEVVDTLDPDVEVLSIDSAVGATTGVDAANEARSIRWTLPGLEVGDFAFVTYNAAISMDAQPRLQTPAAEMCIPACVDVDTAESGIASCVVDGLSKKLEGVCDLDACFERLEDGDLFGFFECLSQSGCDAADLETARVAAVQCMKAAGCSVPEPGVRVSGPVDPNEKRSLAKKFIQRATPLVYAIEYENVGEVDAIDVTVTDVLSPLLDDSTLEIISEGGEYDPKTRELRWNLRDRNLGPRESDVLFFSIRPELFVAAGEPIRNCAEIDFDGLSSLVTDETLNIIDDVVPSSEMETLPDRVEDARFEIAWRGRDTIGEIDVFSVFVSVDGGPFRLFRTTTQSREVFSGETGREYAFYVVATDKAGNAESKEPVAEAQTRVEGEAPVTGFVRGDADNSGTIDITDGVFILNFLFLGGPDPDCLDAADVDDSAAVNITDAIFVLNWLFLGGENPPAPSPSENTYARADCREDPTDDDLGCQVPSSTCGE